MHCRLDEGWNKLTSITAMVDQSLFADSVCFCADLFWGKSTIQLFGRLMSSRQDFISRA